jgi:chromosome segregation ATPase
MLDSVKRIGELRELIGIAREEREALGAALATLATRKLSIDEAIQTLSQTQKMTETVAEALDRATARLDAFEGRTAGLGELEARVDRMTGRLAESQQAADKLLGPDGELAKHQAIAARLAKEEIAARGNIDEIRRERLALDEMRDQLRQAVADVRGATDRFAAAKAELGQLHEMGAQLTYDYNRMRDLSREAREEAQQALDAARETEMRVAALKTLDDVARTAKERIATLNAVVEHVTQKARSIEAQKQTIEHAIIESNRLNEMVWNMDAQVTRLNEGMRQVTQAEEVVERLARLGREAAAQLEAAGRSREAFQADLGRLDQDRAALADFIRGYREHLDTERRQLDAFDQRVSLARPAWRRSSRSPTTCSRAIATWRRWGSSSRASRNRPETWGRRWRRCTRSRPRSKPFASGSPGLTSSRNARSTSTAA